MNVLDRDGQLPTDVHSFILVPDSAPNSHSSQLRLLTYIMKAQQMLALMYVELTEYVETCMETDLTLVIKPKRKHQNSRDCIRLVALYRVAITMKTNLLCSITLFGLYILLIASLNVYLESRLAIS